MNIAIIKGESSYGTLRCLADEICREALILGHSTMVCDFLGKSDYQSDQIAHSLIHGNFDLIITFNGMLSEVALKSGENVLDASGAVVIVFMVDDPTYHYPRLIVPIKKRIFLCPNSSHLKYLDSIKVPNRKSLMLCGAEKHGDTIVDFKSREKRAVVAMSWMGYPQPFWDKIDDSYLNQLIGDTVSTLLKQDEPRPFEVFERCCQHLAEIKNFELIPDEYISFILANIVTYVRQYNRIQLISKIKKSDIPLTLVGHGWDLVCQGANNIRLLPELSCSNLKNVYRESRVVINVNASNGGCERAFMAAINGAAVLSEFNAKYAQHSTRDTEVTFYDLQSESDVVDKLGILLESAEGERRADLGRENCNLAHLWRHRIEEIIGLTKGI